MIMITSPAGVRMARAGKALERAKKEFVDLVGHGAWSPATDAYAEATIEWNEAAKAVLAELHEQNLHDMTGP